MYRPRSLVQALEFAPDTSALLLPILPDHERREVLELFNPLGTSDATEECIHELFEAQVERAPDSVAVLYEGESLKYGELNGRANQLARHLRALSVGPDELVGICVERSLDMVVGLLGIMKAGARICPWIRAIRQSD